MKLLVLLFLVGFAAASVHETLDDVAEEFLLELEQAEDDTKTEMGKKLRETLDEILEKIKDSIDKGKGVKEDMMNKLKEVREKMKELKVDMGNKAKELMEKVKEKVKEFWQRILDNLKQDGEKISVDEQLADFNLKDMFKKLKESLLEKIDKEKLKAKVEELFGKGSEMADQLLEIINKKGEKYKQKLLDLVDRFLGKKDDVESSLFMADDDKNEVGKKLREALDEILEKVKDAIENGKGVKEDVLKKLKEVREKMKELKVDMGNKAKELMEKVKEKVKEYWQRILDNLKQGDEKISVDEQLADFNLKDMFQKLKKSLLEKIDKEKLKAKVEELFGKGSEIADSILDIINKKGDKFKQKLLDLVDRYLGKEEKEITEKRSVKEVWEKVKNYFKDLHIDIKEKYMKFGEWVKAAFEKGMEKGKSKLENIRKIAKEFVDHTKGVSKEVAVEALEFLKPYKEDLGSLWDQVKETVKDIVQKKE